jgi:hypothetical protein
MSRSSGCEHASGSSQHPSYGCFVRLDVCLGDGVSPSAATNGSAVEVDRSESSQVSRPQVPMMSTFVQALIALELAPISIQWNISFARQTN